tara:strand:+ start:889 stop:2697 length:1809 start_codon:yes stop_codon:yes gene_type:complete
MAHSMSSLPMQRLERQVITASDQTTFRFPASGNIQDLPNLPSNAKHIAITIIGKERGDHSAECYTLMRFDDNTSALYNMVRYDIYAGTTKAAFEEYGIVGFSQAGPNMLGNHADTANAFSAATFLFPHALVDIGFDKTFLYLGGNPDTAFTGDSRLRMGHGRYDGDGGHGAITSISFLMQGGDGLWCEGSVGTLAVVDEDYNTSSVTLGSDGTITHGSLGATPENIAIVSTVKGARDYTVDALEVQLNADATGTNYSSTLIDAREPQVLANSAANDNSGVEINGSGSTTAADHAGNHLIQIQQSGNTTGRGNIYSLSGHIDAANAGDFDALLRIGTTSWANTATVTSVKLEGQSATVNMKSGSTSDLYLSPPAEYLLDSVTTSGTAADNDYVEFDLSDYDIPDCSTDLKVLIYGAGNRGGWSAGYDLFLGAEGGSIDTTATNYHTQGVTYATNYGVTGVVSTGNTQMGRHPASYSLVHDDQMGGATITIFEWANTGMHKPFVAFGASSHKDDNGSAHAQDVGTRVFVGRWKNTAKIGLIRIGAASDGTGFRNGTTIELYSTYGTDAAKVGNTKPTNIAKINNTATPHSGTEQKNTRVNGVLI